MNWRVTASMLGTGALLLGLVAAGQGVAAAAARHDGSQTCTGTIDSPGTLAGTYRSNVVVTGACVVDAGPTDIRGNLIVAQGADLTAIFGQDDQTGSGNSNLTVHGNVIVQSGASVMMGCYPLVVPLWGATGILDLPDFPCTDDPNQNSPTLSATEVVDGNVISHNPLGVVLHNTTVRGNVVQVGGGAGEGCALVGIFSKYFGLPEWSDYTNVDVSGNLVVKDLDTCWFGELRDNVRGNMVANDDLSPPDGAEIATNVVHGNLTCRNDNVPVEFGDSDGQPNKVGGNAFGQCGFGVTADNPAPGDVTGVTPVPQPVSVPLH
jgi:hypothetical protein